MMGMPPIKVRLILKTSWLFAFVQKAGAKKDKFLLREENGRKKN